MSFHNSTLAVFDGAKVRRKSSLDNILGEMWPQTAIFLTKVNKIFGISMFFL